MKKKTQIALLSVLCLSLAIVLTACTKDSKAVSKRIDSNIEVTSDSVATVSADEKDKVENVKLLMAQLEEVDENSGEIIEALKTAYEDLDDKQKEEFEDFKDFVLTAQLQYEKALLYSKAMAAKDAGDFEEARKYFMTLFPRGPYKDATEQFDAMMEQYEPILEQQEREEILNNLPFDTSGLVSADKKRVSLPETAPNGVSYAEMAKVYWGDSNLSYIVYPKTDEDHLNNLYYVFLTGNWKYSDADPRQLNDYWVFVGDGYEGQFLEFPKDPAMFGCFANGGNDMSLCYYGGTYYYTKNGLSDEYFYTPEEIQNQLFESYTFVKAKYDEFRKTGKITENSTEYQIAKLYSDWFNSINNQQPAGFEDDPTWEERAKDLRYCPAYAALINHNGMCMSRCAAYCLMMRMEGITVHGLVCGGHGRTIGHIVPWMLLDGKEYVYERNMKLGLLPVDKEHECTREHQFQRYFYNMILKEEGLEYDKSLEGKKYWDDTGNPLSWNEWNAYLKH